jgi:hypothetical protein
MNTKQIRQWVGALAAAACVLSTGAALGYEAVWHCSKHHSISLAPSPFETGAKVEEEELFYLSSFSSQVISISLADLADIYSGRSVSIGNMPLTGCFLAGESALNRAAFQSIGLRWSSLQLMSRRSAIAQSPVRLVQNEADMRACIVNNFPAVGYLSQMTEDEEVAPCF